MPREIMLIIFIFCIIVGVFFLIKGTKIKKNKKTPKKFPTTYGIDKKLDNGKIKEEALILYKKLQTAKTKKDLKILKEILSEELYKKEEQKINLLKEKGHKVVATNIKEENIEVLYSKKEKDKIKAIVFLHISQYDYVVDKNKKVIRGTDEIEYQKEYKMTIEKEKDKDYKIVKKECTGKWIKN